MANNDSKVHSVIGKDSKIKLHSIQGPDPVTDEHLGFLLWQKYGKGISVVPAAVKNFLRESVFPDFLVEPEHDKIFLEMMLKWTFVLMPCWLYMLLKFDYESHPILFAACYGIYLLTFLDQLEHYILALHCVCHRKVFRGPFEKILLYWFWWAIGPMFGETPETYRVHHIGMHHPLNNNFDDLSSTMEYRRDSVKGWLHYIGCFLIMHKNMVELMDRLNPKNVKWFCLGEGCWLLAGILIYQYRPLTATLCYFIPAFAVRIGMITGNWGQHAFINDECPLSNYGHSSVIVNSPYNSRAFNDGYHIMHHCYPTARWTDLPKLFAAELPLLAKHDCIVFDAKQGKTGGPVDWPMLTAFILAGKWDALADHFIDVRALVNNTKPRSKDEIITLLKSRVSKPYKRSDFPRKE